MFLRFKTCLKRIIKVDSVWSHILVDIVDGQDIKAQLRCKKCNVRSASPVVANSVIHLCIVHIASPQSLRSTVRMDSVMERLDAGAAIISVLYLSSMVKVQLSLDLQVDLSSALATGNMFRWSS